MRYGEEWKHGYTFAPLSVGRSAVQEIQLGVLFRLVEFPLLWAYMRTAWQLYLIGSDWRPAREISVPLITAIVISLIS